MNYNREEMIQRVVDCGQELIDKADDIVGHFEYGTDLRITCYIGWSDNGTTPRINIDKDVIPVRFVKRMLEEV